MVHFTVRCGNRSSFVVGLLGIKAAAGGARKRSNRRVGDGACRDDKEENILRSVWPLAHLTLQHKPSSAQKLLESVA